MKLHAILCLALLTALPFAAVAAPKPNIMIMLVDDMGVMDTSVPFLTGDDGQPKRYPLNEFYRTPNMQRLAERGIRFNNFCAMSVCSPTRVSIQTGQNAARHHTTNWINPDTNNGGPSGPPDWNWTGLKKGDVTLASLLHESGYRTIHVGKGHFAPRDYDGANPANIGFDINVAGGSIGAPGSYYGTDDFGAKGRGGNKKAKKQDVTPFGKGSAAVPGLEKYYGQDIFLTEALTLEAKARVADAVKDQQPFFLYFAQYAVHAPHMSDKRFADHYKDSDKPEQARNFATLVEGMDKSLGDMLDLLDELGVAENTLIFFLGDNGSDAPLGHQHAVACAAPLRGKKGSHYEGGTRVPFIAAWAKANASNAWQAKLPIAVNAVQTQQAAVYDMFPTILGLVGAQAPAGHVIDGHLLNTLLTGKPDASRDETFLMHYPHSPHRTDYFTVYRDGRWKVIYHYLPTQEVSGGSHYQLFDLGSDPFEQTDLASSKPDELQRMMQGLVATMEKQGAQYPVDKDTKVPLKPVIP